ncbi:MAG: vWA domain-containing protein [Acidimicrobiales bacterium]
MSPEPGALDEAAFADLTEDDADEAMQMLADLTGATDARLRALARQLAGRVTVDLAAAVARVPVTGTHGRLRVAPLPEVGGDIDLDASLAPLIEARAGGRPASIDDLRGPTWSRPSLALCLLVDRSGSMGGARLAAAAVAAACVALRAPADHSVLAFGEDVIVLQRQGGGRPPTAVADDLFVLRGSGPTDLAGALRAAVRQLGRSDARRRVAVLCSDARPTAGGDPFDAARELSALAELAVLAPADDADDARALVAEVGGRCVELSGPAAVPDALAALFAR